eukprot:jgi/Ulvmu1/7761/UM039_0069.1
MSRARTCTLVEQVHVCSASHADTPRCTNSVDRVCSVLCRMAPRRDLVGADPLGSPACDDPLAPPKRHEEVQRWHMLALWQAAVSWSFIRGCLIVLHHVEVAV